MSNRTSQSPFPANDADRNQIWEMLVPRDIAAFVAADWSMVKDDFKMDGFYAMNGCVRRLRHRPSTMPKTCLTGFFVRPIFQKLISSTTVRWCANISTAR